MNIALWAAVAVIGLEATPSKCPTDTPICSRSDRGTLCDLRCGTPFTFTFLWGKAEAAAELPWKATLATLAREFPEVDFRIAVTVSVAESAAPEDLGKARTAMAVSTLLSLGVASTRIKASPPTVLRGKIVPPDEYARAGSVVPLGESNLLDAESTLPIPSLPTPRR